MFPPLSQMPCCIKRWQAWERSGMTTKQNHQPPAPAQIKQQSSHPHKSAPTGRAELQNRLRSRLNWVVPHGWGWSSSHVNTIEPQYRRHIKIKHNRIKPQLGRWKSADSKPSHVAQLPLSFQDPRPAHKKQLRWRIGSHQALNCTHGSNTILSFRLLSSVWKTKQSKMSKISTSYRRLKQ